jgi:hypothetical protein
MGSDFSANGTRPAHRDTASVRVKRFARPADNAGIVGERIARVTRSHNGYSGYLKTSGCIGASAALALKMGGIGRDDLVSSRTNSG